MLPTVQFKTVFRLLTENVRIKTYTTIILSPNIVVEWVTLLFRIREVTDSNLSPKTGYSD
jgi:hypothetical protein